MGLLALKAKTALNSWKKTKYLEAGLKVLCVCKGKSEGKCACRKTECNRLSDTDLDLVPAEFKVYHFVPQSGTWVLVQINEFCIEVELNIEG